MAEYRPRTVITPGRIQRSRPGQNVLRMPDNTPQYCAFDSDWDNIEKVHDKIDFPRSLNLLEKERFRTARYESTGNDPPFVRLLLYSFFSDFQHNQTDTVVDGSILPSSQGGQLESYLYETYVVKSVTPTTTVLAQRQPREFVDGKIVLRPNREPWFFTLLLFKP